MTLPHPIGRFTPREYYLRESEAADKSEYYQGEIFERSARAWSVREVDGITAMLDVPCIGLQLPMADLYDRVQFPLSWRETE